MLEQILGLCLALFAASQRSGDFLLAITKLGNDGLPRPFPQHEQQHPKHGQRRNGLADVAEIERIG